MTQRLQTEGRDMFIVITQTGTFPSRVLKLVTRAKYNHVSISLQSDLGEMFSFARLRPYNPFVTGFVRESSRWGTFKRFYKTQAVVLKVHVDEECYTAMEERLQWMYAHKAQYHYNWQGLFAAAFHKCVKKKNRYYCSEFVRDFIVEFGVVERDLFHNTVKPIDFLDVFDGKEIYRGELRAFSESANA